MRHWYGASPWTPVAVIGWWWLGTVWTFGNALRASSPSFRILRDVDIAAGLGNPHPLLLFGLIAYSVAALLTLGWISGRRWVRMSGWMVGSGVFAFLLTTNIAASILEPSAALSASVYMFMLLGAHLAAASREST